MNYNQISKIIPATSGTIRLWCSAEAHAERLRNNKIKHASLPVETRQARASKSKEWAHRNPEKMRESRRKWREKQRALKLETMGPRSAPIPGPERCKRWRAKNPDKVRASSANRRATKRDAKPSWFNEDHKTIEEQLHAEAIRLTRETGIAHHVDHIIPLRAKKKNENGFYDFACGLHVPWNLRVVTGLENNHKWAKFPENESSTAW